ncbi:hypothetical protein FPV67DRAFT_1488307 [Lyophyllum atratum]|nr:hypothetical protein FPV67DRAFT_1488307 [Lyophyllum atratum]
MPPTPKSIKPVVTPSTSRSLVPVGPRHVQVKGKNHGVRNENGEKPTTARALVLRNGKYGARGTGEMILVAKLSGREKLDLLAEDLIEQSKTAVMSPFRLEQCLKIAGSQCNAFLDDITNLRDPQLFIHLIQAELNARTKKDKTKSFKDSSYVASVVATRIHNAYMLASAWKLVSETLAQLAIDGLTDGSVKLQLKNNANFRTRYLVLYDLVNVLVHISQSKFSVLATTTPHYARYFKPAPDSKETAPEIIFDWGELREACVSFLDSIIIELCFPRAPYPKAILYQILRDAVEESPKEAKRFPQELWNSVGDLSVSVELQQLLEAPLAGPEGEAWKAEQREMPEEYEAWVDAQIYSEKASGDYANYKDLIFPLERTRTKPVLETMWKYINLNYKAVSGDDIDTLWGLTDALDPIPQWHAYYMPHLAGDSDYDSDSKPNPAGFKGKKKNAKLLAITSGPANDSDDSMPELQSVSNSSDEIDSDDDEDSDYEEDDDDSDSDQSGYDTEEEDELREMLREAMDTAHEADWLHSAKMESKMEGGIDPFAQDDRKGNPFLKLLGSLRGRMFSSSPKLKTATRQEPLKPKLGRAFQPSQPTSKQAPTATQTKFTQAAKSPSAEAKSYKATVEEVEDEEQVSLTKKKKKKKPKKKKKAAATQEALDSDVEVPVSPTVSSSPPPLTKAPVPFTPPASPAPKKVAPKATPSVRTSISLASTTSLPLPSETVAQSARSYIQTENLDAQKSKIKSRPNHATVFTEKPDAKKGFFGRLMSRAKGESKEPPQKGAKHSWFSKLSKKSKGLMHQLLNTADDEMKGSAPMKWENFLRLMREMGFEYDPSTAGSSVRFDPPDKRDGPITFHKPHPDPTLQPIRLKDYAKRLKKHYGWNEEDFLRQTEA